MNVFHFSVGDIVWMVLVLLIILIMLMTECRLYVPFAASGGILVWSITHILLMRRLICTSVPTTGTVIDFRVKTVKIRHKTWIEEYPVYAPIIRYETEAQVIEGICPFWEKYNWYPDGKEILIRYIPSRPELFFLPERERILTEPYWNTLIITFITMVMLFLGMAAGG